MKGRRDEGMVIALGNRSSDPSHVISARLKALPWRPRRETMGERDKSDLGTAVTHRSPLGWMCPCGG